MRLIKCIYQKRKKQVAYGEKKARNIWCPGCDAHFVPDIKKKRARQQTKKEIKKEINYLLGE